MATDKPTRSSGRRDADWGEPQLEGPSAQPDAGPSSTRQLEIQPDVQSDVLPACEIRPFISAAADEIAFAALRERKDKAEHCDLCESPLDDNAGSGLLMWTRGEERIFEEPPLCASCAATIGVTAWVRWTQGEDEYD